jgi:hypothetical protein
MAVPKTAALPLGDTPVEFKGQKNWLEYDKHHRQRGDILQAQKTMPAKHLSASYLN